jgi:hypothetical protein
MLLHYRENLGMSLHMNIYAQSPVHMIFCQVQSLYAQALTILNLTRLVTVNVGIHISNESILREILFCL